MRETSDLKSAFSFSAIRQWKCFSLSRILFKNDFFISFTFLLIADAEQIDRESTVLHPDS